MACRRLPASIVGDPQVGSAFKAPGPLLGTFLAPAAGLCGMLPWHRAPAFQRRSLWLDQASARRALAVPPRGSSDASTTAATSSRCSPGLSGRSRPRPPPPPHPPPAHPHPKPPPPSPRRHPRAAWERLGPLLSSFRRAAGGPPAAMAPPAPTARFTPAGLELMPHQGQLVAAAAAGHRTFLLADEPGLGKTAQALLAAEAANAYPLLVVVPNVVKASWAGEAARWTPRRPATVVQGASEAVDGFADIVVVNYEVVDRHMGWLSGFGFRGIVVDEAHFIKNKTSQRSQHVLALSGRIRSRTDRPLLMALTGTPLISAISRGRSVRDRMRP